MTTLILLRDWQESQIEFWRQTKYEGYDVSTLGRVRSWRGTTRVAGTPGSIRKRRQEPKLCRQNIRDGYPCTSVRTATVDKAILIKVHRLIAIAFLPNPSGLPEVNHKNAIKSDNRYGNLEWVSHTGNMWHAWDSGLYKHQKYSDGFIQTMRIMHEQGKRVNEIAKLTGVSHQYVSEIVNQKKRLRVV